MDTRAFRLGWPNGARVFEVDRPAVINAKEAALARAVAHRLDRRGCAAYLERTLVHLTFRRIDTLSALERWPFPAAPRDLPDAPRGYLVTARQAAGTSSA